MIKGTSLKEKFLVLAINHGQAIAIGDYKKANKIHKKIQEVYKLAKEQDQRNIFIELIHEQDESVRLWAATFALSISPDFAEKALVDLVKSTSIIGLSAKTTLQL